MKTKDELMLQLERGVQTVQTGH